MDNRLEAPYSYVGAERRNKKFVRIWSQIYPEQFSSPQFRTNNVVLVICGDKYTGRKPLTKKDFGSIAHKIKCQKWRNASGDEC